MPNLMYHFVGCDDRLKGISLENFRAQLDYLQRTWPKDEIVLTFDHGTIDHIENAAPELEKRGLQGVFFILTMVQEDRRIPAIDKQRLLEASFRTELARMLCAEVQMTYAPEDASDYLQGFHVYSPEERYLRYLRDKIVAPNTYADFVGKLFEQFWGNEKDWVAKQYMSWDDIVQLKKRGHTIGSHTHYHYGTKADFAKSLKLIEEKTNEKPRCISYPNSWIRVTEQELSELGVRRAYISSENGAEPYRVGRIDCNQFEIIAA